MAEAESLPPTPVIRRRLYHRREQLVQRIRQAPAEPVVARGGEWEDLAARHGIDELLDRFGARDLEELARIDTALRRVDEGIYGRCMACGEPIEPDRLLALPEAELCADCQAQAEVTGPL